MKSLHTLITTAVVAAGCLIIASCTPVEESISGRTYAVQCLWTGGPNDFSPDVEFNVDGTVTHVDDTATLAGTWSEADGNVFWNLNNPPNNTRFRGSFDRNALNGNIEDDLGGTGIFQGSRVD